MNGLVLDTHTVIWYLKASPRLSQHAHQEINACIAAGHPVYVSTVTLAESIYLVEKGKILQSQWDGLLAELKDPNGDFQVTPFDLAAADSMPHVPGSLVPDMPDRMIVATALALGLPLVTRDQRIQTAAVVPTIW